MIDIMYLPMPSQTRFVCSLPMAQGTTQVPLVDGNIYSKTYVNVHDS